MRSRVIERFGEVNARVDEEDLHRELQFAEHVADNAARFLHGGQGRHAVAEDFACPAKQFLRRPLLEREVDLVEVCLSQSRHSSPSAQNGVFRRKLDSREICRFGGNGKRPASCRPFSDRIERRSADAAGPRTARGPSACIKGTWRPTTIDPPAARCADPWSGRRPALPFHERRADRSAPCGSGRRRRRPPARRCLSHRKRGG